MASASENLSDFLQLSCSERGWVEVDVELAEEAPSRGATRRWLEYEALVEELGQFGQEALSWLDSAN